MSTAIYIAALILADAINPGGSHTEALNVIGGLFIGFVVYDILNLRTK